MAITLVYTAENIIKPTLDFFKQTDIAEHLQLNLEDIKQIQLPAQLSGVLYFRHTEAGLQALLGDFSEEANMSQLECNIDDMSGEQLSLLAEAALQRGAADCWFEPIFMKKGRPAYKLGLLVGLAEHLQWHSWLLQHSSTLGVRSRAVFRIELYRETDGQNKLYFDTRGRRQQKPEFDTLRAQHFDVLVDSE